MYGTIFRMKVKPGHEDDPVRVFDVWDSGRKPTVPGALGGLLMKPDRESGKYIGVALFEDAASYRANVEDPGQDAWYGELREHLEADPEWEDGEYVAGSVG